MKRPPAAGGAVLIENEMAQTGSVNRNVYTYYLKAVGIPGAIAILTFQTLFQVSTRISLVKV